MRSMSPDPQSDTGACHVSDNRLLSVVTTSDPAAMRWKSLIRHANAFSLPAGWRVELIFVDDLKQWSGEKEALAAIKALAPELNIRVVWYPDRRGQLAAVMAGIRAAHGDAILTLDPDMGGVLAEITPMLERLERGCLIVHGYRRRRPGLGPGRRLGSLVANLSVRMLTGIRVPDLGSPVTLFSASILPALSKIPPGIHNPRLFIYRYHGARLCRFALRDTGEEGPSHYRGIDLARLYLELLIQCLKIRRALPGRRE